MSASARRRRPFLDSDPPVLFAHRGGSLLWPENTLGAFEESLALGIRFLETDVHETRDGVLVAHHDERVDRTTNGTGAIKDMRYAELLRLDAGYQFTRDGQTFPCRGKGYVIPQLIEVFNLSVRARLNVEIKPPGRRVVRKLWELVDHHGLYDRILVAAENDRQVRRFRRISGGRVATSSGRRETLRFWAASRLGVERLLPLPFDALQVPPEYKGLTVVDPKLVRAAHRNGIQVHVWTIDEPSEMRRLLNIGVDGLMSDRPDRLAALAATIRRQKNPEHRQGPDQKDHQA
jgi:glycerophosphoryl diester phosphodiesterase